MEKTGKCEITGKEYTLKELIGIDSVRPQILELIRKTYPEWRGDKGMISVEILDLFRNEYIRKLIEEENGEMSKLDSEVMESINNKELISTKLQTESMEKPTVGQRIADKGPYSGEAGNSS
jgi:hypothetical protein